MKKIAFHSNNLGLRGTEIALYAYAKYNEEILGNKSLIMCFPDRDLAALDKFKDRFEVQLLHWWEYENYLLENNYDYLYFIKMGTQDGFVLNKVPTIIHAVFRFNDPHGYKYVYVSDWLTKDQGYDIETHSLPHICERLPVVEDNMRTELEIPENATVFGCYAGSTEFNITWVHEAIREVVEKNKNLYFIFMNVNQFCESENVKFLPGTYDLEKKSKFVETCDAMIHARGGGETFGLAVSEFAMSNKPVITYGLSGERSHLDIMGERAIIYNTKDEVKDIFLNLNNYIKFNDYDTPYKQYNPEAVMKKFEKLIS